MVPDGTGIQIIVISLYRRDNFVHRAWVARAVKPQQEACDIGPLWNGCACLDLLRAPCYANIMQNLQRSTGSPACPLDKMWHAKFSDHHFPPPTKSNGFFLLLLDVLEASVLFFED